MPKALDLRALGEEAMTPEVEAKAVPHLCSRQAPDPGLGFEHNHPMARSRQQIRRGDPGRTGPRTATDSFGVRVIRGSLPSPGGRGDLPVGAAAAVRRFTAAPAAMPVRPATRISGGASGEAGRQPCCGPSARPLRGGRAGALEHRARTGARACSSMCAANSVSRLMRAGTNRPLRLGIVGCGYAAEHVHLPVLGRLREVEVVAVAERDPGQLSRVGHAFGIGGLPRLEERPGWTGRSP